MRLSPSLLAADFSALYDEALSVEPLTARYHWDVMDGHFVPNLTFGPPIVNALKRRLRRPFDIHLMIDHPAAFAPQFDVDAEDTIVFHIESLDDPEEVIAAIRTRGAGIGLTLRPGTPLGVIEPYLDRVDQILVMSVEPGFGGQAFLPETLDRLRALRESIGARPIVIAVDGGIHVGNVAEVVAAGGELIIAGSAVFHAEDRIAAMRAMIEACA